MNYDGTERIRRFRTLEIMDIAMRINGTAPIRREAAKRPTVFVRFEGHVHSVYVEIHKDGWRAGSYPDISMGGCLNDDYEMEKILTTLLNVLSEKEKSS